MQKTYNGLFYLEKEYKMKFLEEMSLVAEAVSKAFHAEKMNYELLGNGDTHIHWHLFPRVSGDLEGYGNNGKDLSGGIRWKKCTVRKILRLDELENMKRKLAAELEKRIYAKK